MRSAPIPLIEEERFALGEVIENGELVDVERVTYLMVRASPMLLDFMRAIRIQGRVNRLAEQRWPTQWGVLNQRGLPRDHAGLSVMDAFAQFIAQSPDWAPTTRESYERTASFVEGVFGRSKLIRDVTPTDIATLKDVLIHLPKMYRARYSHLSMADAAELAKTTNLRTRTLSSANRELFQLATFFEWAVGQWIIDRSPVGNVTIPPRLMKPDSARESFTIEHLNRIFSAPLFTGCKDDRYNYFKSGPSRPRGSRFWMPLISLFSGMRLGEIAQLTSDNIREIDGVLCFRITPTPAPDGSHKLFKTYAAKRNIPVHSELLKVGFREFLKGKRGRLFSDLQGETERRKINYFSRWFCGHFLKSVGIIEEPVSFHSFRHSFRDALREGNVHSDYVNLLGGWARRGAINAYGSGGRAPVLAKELEKVAYPGLDLSHLYLSTNA